MVKYIKNHFVEFCLSPQSHYIPLKFLDRAKDDIKEILIASCEIHFNKLITDN